MVGSGSAFRRSSEKCSLDENRMTSALQVLDFDGFVVPWQQIPRHIEVGVMLKVVVDVKGENNA